jgi:hypothetical protein
MNDSEKIRQLSRQLEESQLQLKESEQKRKEEGDQFKQKIEESEQKIEEQDVKLAKHAAYSIKQFWESGFEGLQLLKRGTSLSTHTSTHSIPICYLGH